MPVHDWTKTYAGAFHHLHVTWLVYLSQKKLSSFIEPLRARDRLPDTPLFLDDARFVPLPLESTYMTSFEAVPVHLREEVAGG